VPNLSKSPQYLLGIAVVVSLLKLLQLVVVPILLPVASLPVPSVAITALPSVMDVSEPIPSALAISLLPGTIQQAPNNHHSANYKIAVPLDSSIARKYHTLAQQTGYLEQYPELSGTEMTEYQGQWLTKDAAAAFEQMRRAAAQAGISLRVISGFRSIRTQTQIFEGKGAGWQAAEYSAPPGHSQHHTGLAVDINSLSPSFAETAAFKWLRRYGSQYGFMLSYGNEQGDLGPRTEPWHWVYVAKLPAMQLLTSFIDRAHHHHYDPLFGDRQLTTIYRSTSNLTVPLSSPK
jgi:zinc D-Ala-D-Ala carboxypeptidase